MVQNDGNLLHRTPSRASSRWSLAGSVVFLVIPGLLFSLGIRFTPHVFSGKSKEVPA